jgi:hypothetical protein
MNAIPISLADRVASLVPRVLPARNAAAAGCNSTSNGCWISEFTNEECCCTAYCIECWCL